MQLRLFARRLVAVQQNRWSELMRLPIAVLLALTTPVLFTCFLELPAVAQTTPSADREAEADRLLEQGIQQFQVSQFREAFRSWQQALQIYREIGDQQGEGNALGNLGVAYQTLGQYQRAIDYYVQVLTIMREIGDRRGEGNALGNLGLVYSDFGQYQQAIDYYEQHLTIAREIGDRQGEGNTLGNLGIAYRRLGQYQKVIDYYEQHLAIAKEIGDRQGEGNALGGLGIAYSALGQYSEAIEYYQQSLSIDWEIGDREGQGSALSNIGELLAKQNQPELAIVFLKQSVNVREQIRQDNRGLSQELQQSYTETVSSTYRRLADLLLQENRVLEAQRVLDLLKVQELDDYLRGVQRNAQTEAGVGLRPQEQAALELFKRYEDQLIALGKELAQLSQIPVDQRTAQQTERITQLRNLEQAVKGEFNRFYESSEIQTIVAQLRSTTGAANLELSELNDLRDNLKRLQQTTQQNVVVLYPLILDDRLELILVTADTAPIRRTVDIKRADLNRAIAEFRSALNNPSSDALTPAQTLYNWLIRPLEADLAQAQADTLIYAPDAQLRYIPLAALHDGRQWLVQKLAINNITAASLDDLNHSPAQSSLTLLAAAFTEGQYQVQPADRAFTFAGLEFAGREVENLATLLPQTVKRLNEAFTARIVSEMNDYRIVHLATHATFNPGPPENSFILFGDGSFATLTDVKDWSFPDVDLIVLSACQTAEGDVPLGNGEEILGFGYLMQLAGADAAIASLWSVNDGGTQVLMDAFYAGLKQGLTKAEAMQKAQIALITSDFSALGGPRGNNATIEVISTETGQPISSNQLAHPYYWAPFILIGNGL